MCQVAFIVRYSFDIHFLLIWTSQQGNFFNREETAPGQFSPSQEEVLASDTASLGLIPETKFHPLHTAWIAILQLFLFVSAHQYSILTKSFTNQGHM